MPDPTPGPPVTRSLVTRSIDTLRTLAMDAVEKAKSGHPGTPMALAPLAYALWARVMKYSPPEPDWPDRDRFVLSAGHASMLQYGALHLFGYDLSLDDLKAFRQWGSRTPGHPENHVTPGVEMTTGPLGQGFATAVGMALAERMLAQRFNRPGHEIVDHRTFVVASDGDLMEGVACEAASIAGHLGLDRLCVFYDDNKITIDGALDRSFSEDVAARFAAMGWNVLSVPDTAGPDEYEAAAVAARGEAARPTLVVCRTHIGFGSPSKQDSSKAHGEPLGAEEIRLTKRAYGWPEDASFLVEDAVRAHTRASGARGVPVARDWHRRLAAYRAAFPDDARQLDDALAGRIPEDVDARLASVGSDRKPTSTRKASGAAIQVLAAAIPTLVGGSADLAGSNQTTIQAGGDVCRGSYGGRNLSFGIREHAMGSILNGLTLHGGLRGFGGTFLVFSDYMRPAIRLAALMRLGVVYVFTHDSIGLGEDGPTHQPIEHLASLRAIPGLDVVRPADAVETAAAWARALEANGPTVLALTRQDVRPLDVPRERIVEGVRVGAYVASAEAGGAPELVLLATGSEVGVAIEAAALLTREGRRVRVVSMPSTSRFAAASASVRDAILPPGVPRVAVEAASPFGWHRWVGESGAIVAIDRFGASAPAPRLFEELGITPLEVARIAREVLARAGARRVASVDS